MTDNETIFKVKECMVHLPREFHLVHFSALSSYLSGCDVFKVFGIGRVTLASPLSQLKAFAKYLAINISPSKVKRFNVKYFQKP